MEMTVDQRNAVYRAAVSAIAEIAAAKATYRARNIALRVPTENDIIQALRERHIIIHEPSIRLIRQTVINTIGNATAISTSTLPHTIKTTIANVAKELRSNKPPKTSSVGIRRTMKGTPKKTEPKPASREDEARVRIRSQLATFIRKPHARMDPKLSRAINHIRSNPALRPARDVEVTIKILQELFQNKPSLRQRVDTAMTLRAQAYNKKKRDVFAPKKQLPGTPTKTTKKKGTKRPPKK